MSHKAMSIPAIAAITWARSPRGTGGGKPSRPSIPPGRGEVSANSFFPHRDMSQRIHLADDFAETAHPFANPLHRGAMDFTIADKTVIGAHFRQDDVPGFAL